MLLPDDAPGGGPGALATPSLLPPGTVRFTGDVPAGARRCRVTYGLVLGSYALTLVSPTGQRSAPIWIAGGQPSADLDLRAGFVEPPWWTTAAEYAGLGFTHILPKGLDHILFVIGLFLLGTRVASAAAAGDALHDRPLGHARPVDARRRVAAVRRSSNR